MTAYLSTENLLAIAKQIGVGQVRDLGLLDSAAHRPTTMLFGQEAYPTIHEKAAVLLESLSRNHALVDGNKRLSWVATVVFYGLNGLALHVPEDEAYPMVIAVCTSETDYQESAAKLAVWVGP